MPRSTALVHECYMRLIQNRQLAAQSRGEFLAIASQTMRRVLVDYDFRQVVRRLNGIPLTLPARTLLDLAATETQRDLERALSEARVLKLVSDKQLLHAIERTPSRKGTKALRVLLDHGPAITRSEAERRLLKLIRDANLPQPLTNVRLHGHTVDFCWPQNRLIVEFDGFAFHGHRRAFERDRKRDRTLVAAGYRVIRITWRQLTDESLAVIASVAQALTAAA